MQRMVPPDHFGQNLADFALEPLVIAISVEPQRAWPAIFGDGRIRHEIVETPRIAHQLKAQGLEQGAVLVLEVRQLRVQLRVAAADVVTLEQLAKDRRQLGQFG